MTLKAPLVRGSRSVRVAWTNLANGSQRKKCRTGISRILTKSTLISPCPMMTIIVFKEPHLVAERPRVGQADLQTRRSNGAQDDCRPVGIRAL